LAASDASEPGFQYVTDRDDVSAAAKRRRRRGWDNDGAEKRKSRRYVCHSSANVLMFCLIARFREGSSTQTLQQPGKSMLE
jgi:hypothetical protein